MNEENKNTLLPAAEQSGLITASDRALRSKIESILRSLENLTSKKLRIEYEIKKQKQSLTRKREELKKASKRLTVSLEKALESSTQNSNSKEQEISRNLRILDSRLLQKSKQILEKED